MKKTRFVLIVACILVLVVALIVVTSIDSTSLINIPGPQHPMDNWP